MKTIKEELIIEDITPEYIFKKSKILDKEQLLKLIKEYGEQQYNNGSEAIGWCNYDLY